MNFLNDFFFEIYSEYESCSMSRNTKITIFKKLTVPPETRILELFEAFVRVLDRLFHID